MYHRYWINCKQFFIITGMGILAIPLILYNRLISLRPPHTDVEKLLFQGIKPYPIAIITHPLKRIGLRYAS